MASKKLVIVGIGVVSVVAIAALSAKSIYHQIRDALDFFDDFYLDDFEFDDTTLATVSEINENSDPSKFYPKGQDKTNP